MVFFSIKRKFTPKSKSRDLFLKSPNVLPPFKTFCPCSIKKSKPIDILSCFINSEYKETFFLDHKESQDLVENVLEDFGSIDVLVNNAGITKDNLLMRMGEEDFDKVIEVNLKSS